MLYIIRNKNKKRIYFCQADFITLNLFEFGDVLVCLISKIRQCFVCWIRANRERRVRIGIRVSATFKLLWGHLSLGRSRGDCLLSLLFSLVLLLLLLLRGSLRGGDSGSGYLVVESSICIDLWVTDLMEIQDLGIHHYTPGVNR